MVFQSPSLVRAAALRSRALSLGEHLLDRVQVRRVWGQVEDAGATQLGHLARQGRTLASSLLFTLGGTSVASAEGDQVVALSPQALRFEADWLEHNATRIDAPREEPLLVAELLRRP